MEAAAQVDDQQTDQEIEKANVVILVYDVNNLECIKRLRSNWIPRIIKLNEKASPLSPVDLLDIPVPVLSPVYSLSLN